MVEDQARALAFYTDILGFELKHDVPLGDDRWLTVVSPEGPESVELLLEPVNNPAVPAREFQRPLFDAGIPWTTFAVDDIRQEYERLTALGVTFTAPPTPMGDVTTATFDDTCGNLIMLVGT
jgi:catechol 2,3-dioxygenase-like lactoylglutathione lyase family enzyme